MHHLSLIPIAVHRRATVRVGTSSIPGQAGVAVCAFPKARATTARSERTTSLQSRKTTTIRYLFCSLGERRHLKKVGRKSSVTPADRQMRWPSAMDPDGDGWMSTDDRIQHREPFPVTFIGHYARAYCRHIDYTNGGVLPICIYVVQI